jgi:hypothetical protein
MTNWQFGSTLILLGLLYGFNKQIIDLLNEKLSFDFKFKTTHLNYVLFVILTITIIIGMKGGTKNHINVSKGVKNLNPSGNSRPHPLFDIDTYW